MTKQIKGSLDEILIELKRLMQWSQNGIIITEEDILNAIEKFVVGEEKCIIHSTDMKGICFKCGKKSYHMIPTERKEESVEIHHHSTASVISIDMYQHEGGSEIFKSEMWMDYSVFEKLKEAIDAKANGELSFLFPTTPKKGGDDDC